MTGRTVAVVEWVLAAVLLVWFVFFLMTQASSGLTLGPVISSLFIAPGLAVSLAINAVVHFRRRERLTTSEHVMLGIEAVIIVLLVVASVIDQTTHVAGGSLPDWGHWLEWFLPLWVLLGPIAMTVLILGIVKRRPSAPARQPA
jgi:type IV secretory pathway VirB2 component (pilin)